MGIETQQLKDRTNAVLTYLRKFEAVRFHCVDPVAWDGAAGKWGDKSCRQAERLL